MAESDQAIGEVITNLNTVLETTVRHREQFDATIDKLHVLITALKGRADPLADATAFRVTLNTLLDSARTGWEVPVRVKGVRTDGTVVIEGTIRLWVTEKPAKS